MTCELLNEMLQEMESQMAVIEQAVEIETKRRYEQGTIKLKDLYRNSELEANSVKGTKCKKAGLGLDALFKPVTNLKVDQEMDEVF